jgi:hypothetical protein
MLGALILGVLAGKVVISLAAASPTQWWLAWLGWISRTWQTRKVRRLRQAMDQKTANTGFCADLSFVPEGIGLAIDTRSQMLFLAEENGNAIAAMLLPVEALAAVRRGESNISGFHDHYVELRLHEGRKSKWRILCGDNSDLAKEVEQTVNAMLNGALEPLPVFGAGLPKSLEQP